MHFYSNLAQYARKGSYVPKLLAQYITDTEICLAMEDLKESGYINETVNGNIQLLKPCVKWLANFHATYINLQDSKIAQQGSYWYLDTRPEEFENMPDSLLKQSAKSLDKALRQAQFKTLLHGDAKLGNFCFDKEYQHCAAIDFQYSGLGVGVKDVVYLLGSALDENELFSHADSVIDLYFGELKSAMSTQFKPDFINNLISEWRTLIPICWADFERFLLGWAPGHTKLNAYSKIQTERAIQAVNLGD